MFKWMWQNNLGHSVGLLNKFQSVSDMFFLSIDKKQDGSVENRKKGE